MSSSDFNKPVITDTYTNVLAELVATAKDLALAMDPANTSPANTPTNAVRWNGANSYWEKFGGSTWGALASTYNITVTGGSAKWNTARTLTFTGDATGSGSVDGSGNVSFAMTGVQAAKWNTARTLTFTGDATGSGSVDGSGNVSFAMTGVQAAKLTTARTLSFTGDATGTGSFDGSANLPTALTLANSGVTAGTYGSTSAIPVVVVDAKGRITGISTASFSVPVTSVFGRTGAVTLGSGDVTGALGFTPQDAAYFSVHQSIASSGYQKLPGGLILQWGVTTSVASNTNFSVTFPVSFPNSCFHVDVMCTSIDAGPGENNPSVYARSPSGFSAAYLRMGTATFTWFSVGN